MAAALASWRPARAGGRRWLVPIALSAVIAVWQLSFNSASPDPHRPYAMTASMGLCQDAPYFFYFFHHFGVFPVGALEVPGLGPSKQAAADFVAHHGDRLTMDFGWPTNTPRFGDYAKLFLFYPDLLLRGDPGHASALPFNELLFIVALLAVFWAFWLEGYGRLGALLVVLVGSDPFQLVETYGRGNIFSIPISVALLALAAHLRFLTGRRGVDGPAWAIAIVSGAALATFREVRAEAGLMAASVLATYLLARAPRARRFLLAAVFVLAFALTGHAWTTYWAGRFVRAEQFVARAGGQVFRAPHGTHHAFWHAIACGLGDYGADRGFTWDDRVAFRWATTRDPGHQPGSHSLPLRERLLPRGDLRRRPPHRADRSARVQPARARAGPDRDPPASAVVRPASCSSGRSRSCAMRPRRHFPSDRSRWASPAQAGCRFPVLVFALWRRKFFHAMLILFVLPLSAVALIVYSAKGMTFYGISHLVALAVPIDLLARSRRAALVEGRPMSPDRTDASRRTLCVVSPCFNEAAGIRAFYAALKDVLASLARPRSSHRVRRRRQHRRDAPGARRAGRRRRARVRVYSLSRNFGHQVALTAGCDVAQGDALVLMDSDLQHPPALIPAMVAKWREGADVVSAVRLRTADALALQARDGARVLPVAHSISDTPIVPTRRTSCCSRPWRATRCCACPSATASCAAWCPGSGSGASSSSTARRRAARASRATRCAA